MSALQSYFRIECTDDLRRGLLLAAGSFLLAIVLLSGLITEPKPLSGDEPHYLVVAHSIASDGDLNLQDDYNEEKCWQAFYPGQLSPHYAPGLEGKYSTRSVGLSYYLLPWYLIGQATDAIPFWTRLGMGLLFALFIMQTYLLLRDLEIEVTPALSAVVISALCIPLVFYSYSIFPEIPTALLTVISVRLMLNWDQKTLLNPLFAGVALALLPWLGVKYGVIAAVFGIGIVLYIITSRGPLFRSVCYFALFPIISLLGLLLFLWMIYGVFSPQAIYAGVGENARSMGGFNMQAYGENTGNVIGSFFRVMLLYLFDQRDGLLFYSPFYLLGITGLLMIQGKRKFSRTMLLGFLVYWIAYALSAWYSGYAPSARPLVSVLWMLIVGLAYVLTRVNRKAIRLIVIVTVSFALAFSVLHISQPHLIYHVIDYATQDFGNNFVSSIAVPFDLTLLFPNLVSPHDIHPLPVIVFITLAIALGVITWKHFNTMPDGQGNTSSAFLISALLAAGLPILLVLVSSQMAIIIAPQEMQGDGNLRLVFNDGNTYGFEPVQYQGETHIGFWQQGGTTTEVYAVCGSDPADYQLFVHSRVPQKVMVQVVSQINELTFQNPGWQTITIPGEIALNWTHRKLLPMRITTERGFRPSDEGKEDTRYLGARIAIAEVP